MYFILHFNAVTVPEDGTATANPKHKMVDGLERYDSKTLDRAVLRLTGLRIPEERRGRIEFKVYIDMLDANDGTSESGPHFLGAASKRWREEDGPESVFLEITAAAKEFIDNRHENALTIVSTGGTALAWDHLDIALYADC